MPPKIIHDSSHENYVPEVKKRSKPKPYIESESIKQYRLERDRIIYKTTKDEQTRQDKTLGNDTGLMSKREMAELMPGYDYHKPRAKSKHEESDLHLKFCKWVKKEYPGLQFVRHEREQKRSFYMQNLMQVYNSDEDKLPDFELLQPSAMIPYQEKAWHYHRLYIEFKKPGESWLMADGKTVKKPYRGQAARHQAFWDIGSCAYFCNDLQDAKILFELYIIGTPRPKQVYIIPVEPITDLPF